MPGSENNLSRFEKIVFGDDRRKQQSSPATPERRRHTGNLTKRVIPVIISVLLLAMFVFAAQFYSSTRQRIEGKPFVVNLTKAGVNAKIAFGDSPTCKGAPCWVQPGFDDSHWRSQVLPFDPNENIRAQENYQIGLKTGWMYYRYHLPISSELASLDRELSFTPMYIQHQKFRVFLNGRLVFTGNGVAQGRIANFPIPKSDIKNGKVFIAIQASVLKNDVGITHYASVLLGPKDELDTIYVHQERAQGTYYLLFLSSKGSIFIIFTLFFLYTRGQVGFVHFLIFAFFSTIENIFVGDFLSSEPLYLNLSERVLFFFSCKVIAVGGLLGFLLNFYQARGLLRSGRLINGLLTMVVIATAYDFGWGSKTATFGHLHSIVNNFLVAAIASGIILGIISIRMWRSRQADGMRLKSLYQITGFLGVYLALIIWEFYFVSFSGFNLRPVYDLAFFLGIALITAKDMGFKETKIKSLTGHMEEKRRMQLELQEAAEIAKAFMPQSVPSWRPFDIEIFHQPLTENSGDWYAFEKGPSGNLFHFMMCDITGHGVQAAIVVSTCKSVLTTLTYSSPEILDRKDFVGIFARQLNATLYANGSGNHVSTLLALTFVPRAKTLYHMTAGHPPPIFFTSGGDGTAKPRPLASRNNILGIRYNFEPNIKKHHFSDGDQLIAYTDGLPLNRNVKTLQRFVEQLSTSFPAGDIPRRLSEKIWQSEIQRSVTKPGDDISVVWFKAVA